MPPNQYNPYDFINNTPQQRRGINPGSKKARIFLVIGGVLILIILAVVANKILAASGNAQTNRLVDVAQAETELIRVSTLGTQNAKDRDTITFAYNTKLSVESSQVKTKQLLNKRGIKDKKFSKLMATSKNSKTDTALTTAGKNNRYDEALKTVLVKQLGDYQKLLKTANSGGTAKEKTTLAASFKNAGMLLPKKDTTTSTDSSDDTTE